MLKPLLNNFVLIILSSFLLAACDQDPFHQSYKNISGKFYLHRWEDGKTYYIEEKNDSAKQNQGGGAINGTVQKIGWDADHILAKRQSTFHGDLNGWMLLDAKTGNISGPFSDLAITQMPEAKSMKFLNPEDAWNELH